MRLGVYAQLLLLMFDLRHLRYDEVEALTKTPPYRSLPLDCLEGSESLIYGHAKGYNASLTTYSS